MYDSGVPDSQDYELAKQLLKRYDDSGVLRPIGYEWHSFMKLWRNYTGRLQFNNGCRPCVEEAINDVRKAIESNRSF
jgi:hypothetical protein